MITENVDVKNGICDGTTGYITEIKKENGKETYIITQSQFHLSITILLYLFLIVLQLQ